MPTSAIGRRRRSHLRAAAASTLLSSALTALLFGLCSLRVEEKDSPGADRKSDRPAASPGVPESWVGELPEEPAVSPTPGGEVVVPAAQYRQGYGARADTARGESSGARPEPGADSRSSVEDVPFSVDGEGATLTVRVSDAENQPASGVAVAAISDSDAFESMTDDEGLAVFSGLQAGLYSVEVDEARLGGSTRDVLIESGSSLDVEIVLRPQTHSIAGRVLESGGRPVPGMPLRVTPLDRGGGELSLQSSVETNFATSDSGGHFAFFNLSGGDYLVEAMGAGDRVVAARVAKAPSEGIELLLGRQGGLIVRGFVRTADGGPLSGARVTAASSRLLARSDRHGYYEIEIEDPPPRLELRALAKHHLETIRVLGVPDGAPSVSLDFTLEPLDEPAELEGRLSGPDGERLGAEKVHLSSASRDVRTWAVTDPDGFFRFTDIPAADDYRLRVQPERFFRDWSLEGLRVRHEDTHVDIALESRETVELRGVVVDAYGAPLPDFTFQLRSPDALASPVAATTDARGRFFLSEAPIGDVLMESRSMPLISTTGIRVDAGDVAEVRIPTMVGREVLEGRVVDAEGTPLAGARVVVEIKERDGRIVRRLQQAATTDSEGLFALRGMGAGDGYMTVSAQGFRPLTRQVSAGTPEASRVRPVVLLPAS